MKRISLILAFSIIATTSWAQFKTPLSIDPFLNKSQVGANAMPDQIAPITAPFDMPQLEKPKFPDYSLDITTMGAKPRKKATKNIQNAIDRSVNVAEEPLWSLQESGTQDGLHLKAM